MKRGLLLILIFFALLYSPIKAQNNQTYNVKPIITLSGKNYGHLTSIEGYEIISNNVNWFVPGAYSIVYRVSGGVYIVNRKVIVLSKYDFLNGGYHEVTIHDRLYGASSLERIILASHTIDETKAVWVQSVYDSQDQERGSDIVISLYDTNQIIWETTLHKGYGDYIKKIISNGNVIVAVGTTYDEIESQNGWLIELDMNGTITKDIQYGGTKRDYFNDVLIFDQSYVVFGKSNSNDGFFVNKTFQGDDYDGLIMIINRSNFFIDGLYQYGAEGNDEFHQAVFRDNHFYITASSEGFVGILSDGFSYRRRGIVKISLFGFVDNMRWMEYVNELESNKIMIDDFRNIYLIQSIRSSLYQKHLVSIYKVGENLTYELVDSYIYPSELVSMSFKDCHIDTDGNIVVLNQIITSKNNQVKYGYYIRKYHNGQVIQETDYFGNESFISPISILDGEKIMILAQESKIGIGTKPVLISNSHFSSKSLGSTIINQYKAKIDDYELYIDNRQILHSVEKSNIEYNANSFGYYTVDYVFDQTDFLIAFTKEIYVSENINASSGEVYSKGYILRFNGEGYLNGKKINTNHQVVEQGVYVLEVIGKDGIKKLIDFSVEEVAENNETHLIKSEKLKYFTTTIYSRKIEHDNQVEFISNLPTRNDLLDMQNLKNWYFIIPIFCLGVTITYAIKGVKE